MDENNNKLIYEEIKSLAKSTYLSTDKEKIAWHRNHFINELRAIKKEAESNIDVRNFMKGREIIDAFIENDYALVKRSVSKTYNIATRNSTISDKNLEIITLTGQKQILDSCDDHFALLEVLCTKRVEKDKEFNIGLLFAMKEAFTELAYGV